MWVYAALVNPGAYAAAALAAGVSVAHQEQITMQHKEMQTAYTKYLGAQEAGKDILLYGVGDDALAPLKKAIHQFWQCNHPLNDTTPLGEDGNQDDHLPEVQVQG